MWILDPKSPGKENVSDMVSGMCLISLCVCVYLHKSV